MVAGNAVYNGARAAAWQLAEPASTSGPVVVVRGPTLGGGGGLPSIAAANAVQTLSLTRIASGTFTITFNGQTTAAIAYSTTPATTAGNIQAALAALPGIGAGNVERGGILRPARPTTSISP